MVFFRRRWVGRGDNFWHDREMGSGLFFFFLANYDVNWLSFNFPGGWGLKNPPRHPPPRSVHAFAFKRTHKRAGVAVYFLKIRALQEDYTCKTAVAWRVFYIPHVCPFYCNTCKNDWYFGNKTCSLNLTRFQK